MSGCQVKPDVFQMPEFACPITKQLRKAALLSAHLKGSIENPVCRYQGITANKVCILAVEATAPECGYPPSLDLDKK